MNIINTYKRFFFIGTIFSIVKLLFGMKFLLFLANLLFFIIFCVLFVPSAIVLIFLYSHTVKNYIYEISFFSKIAIANKDEFKGYLYLLTLPLIFCFAVFFACYVTVYIIFPILQFFYYILIYNPTFV